MASDLDSLDEDFPDLTDPAERAHIIRLLSNQPLRSPERATRTRPGTPGRVAVYEARFAAGQAIFHGGDSTLRDHDDAPAYTAPVLSNGALGAKSESLAESDSEVGARLDQEKAARKALKPRNILPFVAAPKRGG